jgi:hypothetical protein
MATAAWLNNKLGSAEWPHASSILDHLPDILKLWTSGDLDAMAKVRACVACAMLSKKRREEMSDILAELGSAARSDGDEWVKVIGNAVGDFDSTMNLKAVLEASGAVAESYDSIQALLSSTEESQAPAAPFRLEGFSPLEDKFMHFELQEGQEEEKQPKPDEIHFKPRASQPPLDFTLSPAFVSALSGKKINKQAMSTSNLQPSKSIFIPVAISRSGRDGSGLLKAPSIDHSAAGTPRGGVTDVVARNMKRPRMDEPQTKAPPSIESETI